MFFLLFFLKITSSIEQNVIFWTNANEKLLLNFLEMKMNEIILIPILKIHLNCEKTKIEEVESDKTHFYLRDAFFRFNQVIFNYFIEMGLLVTNTDISNDYMFHIFQFLISDAGLKLDIKCTITEYCTQVTEILQANLMHKKIGYVYLKYFKKLYIRNLIIFNPASEFLCASLMKTYNLEKNRIFSIYNKKPIYTKFVRDLYEKSGNISVFVLFDLWPNIHKNFIRFHTKEFQKNGEKVDYQTCIFNTLKATCLNLFTHNTFCDEIPGLLAQFSSNKYTIDFKLVSLDEFIEKNGIVTFQNLLVQLNVKESDSKMVVKKVTAATKFLSQFFHNVIKTNIIKYYFDTSDRKKDTESINITLSIYKFFHMYNYAKNDNFTNKKPVTEEIFQETKKDNQSDNGIENFKQIPSENSKYHGPEKNLKCTGQNDLSFMINKEESQNHFFEKNSNKKMNLNDSDAKNSDEDSFRHIEELRPQINVDFKAKQSNQNQKSGCLKAYLKFSDPCSSIQSADCDVSGISDEMSQDSCKNTKLENPSLSRSENDEETNFSMIEPTANISDIHKDTSEFSFKSPSISPKDEKNSKKKILENQHLDYKIEAIKKLIKNFSFHKVSHFDIKSKEKSIISEESKNLNSLSKDKAYKRYSTCLNVSECKTNQKHHLHNKNETTGREKALFHESSINTPFKPLKIDSNKTKDLKSSNNEIMYILSLDIILNLFENYPKGDFLDNDEIRLVLRLADLISFYIKYDFFSSIDFFISQENYLEYESYMQDLRTKIGFSDEKFDLDRILYNTGTTLRAGVFYSILYIYGEMISFAYRSIFLTNVYKRIFAHKSLDPITGSQVKTKTDKNPNSKEKINTNTKNPPLTSRILFTDIISEHYKFKQWKLDLTPCVIYPCLPNVFEADFRDCLKNSISDNLENILICKMKTKQLFHIEIMFQKILQHDFSKMADLKNNQIISATDLQLIESTHKFLLANIELQLQYMIDFFQHYILKYLNSFGENIKCCCRDSCFEIITGEGKFEKIKTYSQFLQKISKNLSGQENNSSNLKIFDIFYKNAQPFLCTEIENEFFKNTIHSFICCELLLGNSGLFYLDKEVELSTFKTQTFTNSDNDAFPEMFPVDILKMKRFQSHHKKHYEEKTENQHIKHNENQDDTKNSHGFGFYELSGESISKKPNDDSLKENPSSLAHDIIKNYNFLQKYFSNDLKDLGKKILKSCKFQVPSNVKVEFLIVDKKNTTNQEKPKLKKCETAETSFIEADSHTPKKNYCDVNPSLGDHSTSDTFTVRYKSPNDLLIFDHYNIILTRKNNDLNRYSDTLNSIYEKLEEMNSEGFTSFQTHSTEDINQPEAANPVFQTLLNNTLTKDGNNIEIGLNNVSKEINDDGNNTIPQKNHSFDFEHVQPSTFQTIKDDSNTYSVDDINKFKNVKNHKSSKQEKDVTKNPIKTKLENNHASVRWLYDFFEIKQNICICGYYGCYSLDNQYDEISIEYYEQILLDLEKADDQSKVDILMKKYTNEASLLNQSIYNFTQIFLCLKSNPEIIIEMNNPYFQNIFNLDTNSEMKKSTLENFQRTKHHDRFYKNLNVDLSFDDIKNKIQTTKNSSFCDVMFIQDNQQVVVEHPYYKTKNYISTFICLATNQLLTACSNIKFSSLINLFEPKLTSKTSTYKELIEISKGFDMGLFFTSNVVLNTLLSVSVVLIDCYIFFEHLSISYEFNNSNNIWNIIDLCNINGDFFEKFTALIGSFKCNINIHASQKSHFICYKDFFGRIFEAHEKIYGNKDMRNFENRFPEFSNIHKKSSMKFIGKKNAELFTLGQLMQYPLYEVMIYQILNTHVAFYIFYMFNSLNFVENKKTILKSNEDTKKKQQGTHEKQKNSIGELYVHDGCDSSIQGTKNSATSGKEPSQDISKRNNDSKINLKKRQGPVNNEKASKKNEMIGFEKDNEPKKFQIVNLECQKQFGNDKEALVTQESTDLQLSDCRDVREKDKNISKANIDRDRHIARVKAKMEKKKKRKAIISVSLKPRDVDKKLIITQKDSVNTLSKEHEESKPNNINNTEHKLSQEVVNISEKFFIFEDEKIPDTNQIDLNYKEKNLMPSGFRSDEIFMTDFSTTKIQNKVLKPECSIMNEKEENKLFSRDLCSQNTIKPNNLCATKKNDEKNRIHYFNKSLPNTLVNYNSKIYVLETKNISKNMLTQSFYYFTSKKPNLIIAHTIKTGRICVFSFVNEQYDHEKKYLGIEIAQNMKIGNTEDIQKISTDQIKTTFEIGSQPIENNEIKKIISVDKQADSFLECVFKTSKKNKYNDFLKILLKTPEKLKILNINDIFYVLYDHPLNDTDFLYIFKLGQIDLDYSNVQKIKPKPDFSEVKVFENSEQLELLESKKKIQHEGISTSYEMYQKKTVDILLKYLKEYYKDFLINESVICDLKVTKDHVVIYNQLLKKILQTQNNYIFFSGNNIFILGQNINILCPFDWKKYFNSRTFEITHKLLKNQRFNEKMKVLVKKNPDSIVKTSFISIIEIFLKNFGNKQKKNPTCILKKYKEDFSCIFLDKDTMKPTTFIYDKPFEGKKTAVSFQKNKIVEFSFQQKHLEKQFIPSKDIQYKKKRTKFFKTESKKIKFSRKWSFISNRIQFFKSQRKSGCHKIKLLNRVEKFFVDQKKEFNLNKNNKIHIYLYKKIKNNREDSPIYKFISNSKLQNFMIRNFDTNKISTNSSILNDQDNLDFSFTTISNKTKDLEQNSQASLHSGLKPFHFSIKESNMPNLGNFQHCKNPSNRFSAENLNLGPSTYENDNNQKNDQFYITQENTLSCLQKRSLLCSNNIKEAYFNHGSSFKVRMQNEDPHSDIWSYHEKNSKLDNSEEYLNKKYEGFVCPNHTYSSTEDHFNEKDANIYSFKTHETGDKYNYLRLEPLSLNFDDFLNEYHSNVHLKQSERYFKSQNNQCSSLNNEIFDDFHKNGWTVPDSFSSESYEFEGNSGLLKSNKYGFPEHEIANYNNCSENILLGSLDHKEIDMDLDLTDIKPNADYIENLKEENILGYSHSKRIDYSNNYQLHQQNSPHYPVNNVFYNDFESTLYSTGCTIQTNRNFREVPEQNVPEKNNFDLHGQDLPIPTSSNQDKYKMGPFNNPHTGYRFLDEYIEMYKAFGHFSTEQFQEYFNIYHSQFYDHSSIWNSELNPYSDEKETPNQYITFPYQIHSPHIRSFEFDRSTTLHNTNYDKSLFHKKHITKPEKKY